MESINDYEYGQYYEKDKYERLLNLVLEALKVKKDASLEEIRKYILDKSGVLEELKDFYKVKKYAPGAIINISTPYSNSKFVIGNQQEVFYDAEKQMMLPSKIEMNDDAIFDLASTTKLFTAIATLMLIADGTINFDDKVGDLAPQFVNLKELTVENLLNFKMIRTDLRVDTANNFEEAEERLFNAKSIDLNETDKTYNDFAPMVLKYIIENVTSMKYYDFLKEKIFLPLKMNDTHAQIPGDKIYRVANSNYDGRYYDDGNFLIRTSSPVGISSDDKAKILGQPFNDLPGHAGLFSTSNDLNSFGQGLIDYKVLDEKMIEQLGNRKVGKVVKDPLTNAITATQFYSYLAYVQHPLQDYTEVHHGLSNNSFSGAGWTGTYFSVDPKNKIVYSLLSNRTHNRMTQIGKNYQNEVRELEDGRKVITLPNGIEMTDSTRYAHLRTEIINKCIELAMMYRILENIVKPMKEEAYIYHKN